MFTCHPTAKQATTVVPLIRARSLEGAVKIVVSVSSSDLPPSDLSVALSGATQTVSCVTGLVTISNNKWHPPTIIVGVGLALLTVVFQINVGS